MTIGTATGAHPRSRSHHRADTQREPIQSAGVTPRRPDSRRLNAAAPFITNDECALIFGWVVLCSPILIVAALHWVGLIFYETH